MANAVLVIDMVRGFLEEGCPLYCGQTARNIVPAVAALIKDELSKGSKVFFLGDCHEADDAEFKSFPPHCINGTAETEIISELAQYEGEYIAKTRYSAFFNTPLADKLAALKPEKLIICGVCTDICVLHTVADARNFGYLVEVPVNCVASFDRKAHLDALNHMGKVLAAVLTGKPEVIKTDPHFKFSPEVISGETADVYFARTLEILKLEKMNPVTTMEIFPSRDGILCGIKESLSLLQQVLPPTGAEVWALPEGESVVRKEVVLRIAAPYQSYGLYETAMLGMLAQGTGWATAASECVAAARGLPVISFGARHVHPHVAGVMDYAAVVAGCRGCSSSSGAVLCDISPSGTIPHALVLIMGDTVLATEAFDKHMPSEIPRITLVDTFKDETEESLRVAAALKEKLSYIRLDSPWERGGVTIDLVKETRARLDIAGFPYVKIFVSGGITPQRITQFLEDGAPVDGFGIGSYISGAQPIDFTADIHEIDGKPIAKRGRIPGITQNPRLQRII